MKRMSEMFALPVRSGDVYIASDITGFEKPKNEIFQCAAHAINNIDALADALDKAISLLSYPASERLAGERELLDVLNAYRGAK